MAGLNDGLMRVAVSQALPANRPYPARSGPSSVAAQGPPGTLVPRQLPPAPVDGVAPSLKLVNVGPQHIRQWHWRTGGCRLIVAW